MCRSQFTCWLRGVEFKCFFKHFLFCSQLSFAIGLSVSPHVAQAQRDRVMGSAGEGSQHRILYLREMDKKAAEREHCRVLTDRVIFPELSKYADLGLGRHEGPSRALFDDAKLKRALYKTQSQRAELLRLAQALSSENLSRDNPMRARLQRKVDALVREYRIHSQAAHNFAKDSLQRRELAALNFRTFALAVLVVSRSHECQNLCNSIKPHIPVRLGQKVIHEKRKATAVVASIEKHSDRFSEVLAQLRLSRRGQQAVADSTVAEPN